MQVFAVWEPILSSDWAKPGNAVASRISDPRVKQFWDKQHVLAQRLAKDVHPPQPKQTCCERSGNLWDLAAVYPPGARWLDAIPPAIFFNGPVVRMKPGIEAALAALTK